MPQIQQLALVYQSQWLWLLITLGVIFFVVGRGIVPKVEETVDSRDTRIAADLEAAERARSEAEATEQTWRAEVAAVHADAQAAAADTKSKAAQEETKRVAKADAELAARAAEANARLAEARASALSAVEDVAAEAARDMVAKLSGAEISKAEASEAVKMAMANG